MALKPEIGDGVYHPLDVTFLSNELAGVYWNFEAKKVAGASGYPSEKVT